MTCTALGAALLFSGSVALAGGPGGVPACEPEIVGRRGLSFAWDLDILGTAAIVTSPLSPIAVYDLSHPYAIDLVTYFGFQHLVSAVAVSGSWAYFADYSPRTGVHVIDMSDLENPVPAGFVATGNSGIREMRVEGGVLYAASRRGGLLTIDVSDPSSAALLGSCDSIPDVLAVEVVGGLAYIAGRDWDGEEDLGLFRIVDVSDPATPVDLGGVSWPINEGVAIAVRSDHAYIAAYEAGLHVVDVSDPSSPALVQTLDMGGPVSSVRVSGSRAYVTAYTDSVAEESTLIVLGLNDPGAPMVLGSADGPGYFEDVRIMGPFAVVLGGMSWIHMVDVSSCCAPACGGYCGVADCAPPYGTLDQADVLAFLTSFLGEMDGADLAAPENTWDYSDVLAFLAVFAAGCP